MQYISGILVRLSLIVIAAFVFIFSYWSEASASSRDPRNFSNNRFGIHILEEHDIEDAAKLVNSSGGDWGYVTLVIRLDQMDARIWQRKFDKMRELHLIPIVRVATLQTSEGWVKPSHEQIKDWVNFFDRLNWVIKNRYVVIGNEPNHAKEWGGEINPQEYADYLYEFSKALKSRSDEFFVLPAGFDASAPSSTDTLDQVEFMSQMLEHNAESFRYIDGWNSHSYPNPAFSGSPSDSGRGTVRTFDWELKLLDELGIDNDFPVFITETGWVHNAGESVLGYSNEEDVSSNFKQAFTSAWDDERIVAVTPFLLNYIDYPFKVFSWKKPDGSFYQFYHDLVEFPKTQGKPVQKNIARLVFRLTPKLFTMQGEKFSMAFVQNTGQTIWTDNDVFEVDTKDGKRLLQVIQILGNVAPFHYTLAYTTY